MNYWSTLMNVTIVVSLEQTSKQVAKEIRWKNVEQVL